VWASYRFVAFLAPDAKSGLRDMDLGAGHSSATNTLCGRVLDALRSEGLLNEGVGPAYLSRHWPTALKERGAWPLSSLRKSFLDGSLTRLTDPTAVLRSRIVKFVLDGDFGLGSRSRGEPLFGRVWYEEAVDSAELVFDDDVCLLLKTRAEELARADEAPDGGGGGARVDGEAGDGGGATAEDGARDPGRIDETDNDGAWDGGDESTMVYVSGQVPVQSWNRIGISVLPKMRSGHDLSAEIKLSVTTNSRAAGALVRELRRAIADLDLGESLGVRRESE